MLLAMIEASFVDKSNANRPAPRKMQFPLEHPSIRDLGGREEAVVDQCSRSVELVIKKVTSVHR